MGVSSMLLLLLTHPNDFRTVTQYWLWHESKRDITSTKEHPTTGWDRQSMRRCWEFLDMTSRSFSAVIKEVEGDLARVICIFYLVLRGLDTVEDDMTLANSIKQPLLRSFHEKIVTRGWTFDGCGPREKDRQLLVEFNVVVDEIYELREEYRDVIVDICRKMAIGMADYAHKAAIEGTIGLDTITDFDLYCHYVAGLVGEGLSRIFSVSSKEAVWLGDQLALSNASGMFLQKTNILRDFREDVDQGRLFWPKEIYQGRGFKDPQEMYQPENERRALWALSAMTVNALCHSTDVLDYLTLLRNQSVFTFVAIPQTMAIATLAVCFMNPQIFHRNVKIRRAEAARLIMRSTNPRDVAYMFRDYARAIHRKATPADPNFLALSVVCGKIEQWCEHHYPSFVDIQMQHGQVQQTVNTNDPRSRIVEAQARRTYQSRIERRAEELRTPAQDAAVAAEQQNQISTNALLFYTGGAMVLVLSICMAAVFGVIKYADEISGWLDSV